MKKIIFLLFISVIFGNLLKAQPDYFPFDSITNPLTNKIETELLKNCTSFIGQQEFNFNFSTEDLENNVKVNEDIEEISEYSGKSPEELIAMQKGDYTDANLNYEIALKYSGQNNDLMFNQYITMALDNCENAIQTVPEPTDYFHIKENIYSRFGKTEELIKTCEKAIEINPKDKNSYALLTINYLDNKEYEKAKELCKKGIEEMPKNEISYFYLILTEVFEIMSNKNTGENIFELNNTEDIFSINIFKDAVEKYPENKTMELSYNMTKQYILLIKAMNIVDDIKNIGLQLSQTEKKEIKDLINYYKKIIAGENFNNKYTIYYALGAIEVLSGDYIKSIEYTKKALADRKLYAPTNTTSYNDIYNNLAAVNILQGDTSACIEVLKDKILEKENTDDYNLLASIYFSTGDYSSMEAILNEVI